MMTRDADKKREQIQFFSMEGAVALYDMLPSR